MPMLKRFFHENPKIALGFSGGVDSSYLLYAAVKYGVDVRPYYVKTEFQPDFEYLDAAKMAKSLGVPMKVIECDVTANEQVARNDGRRCYYCKMDIFGRIIDAALLDGYPTWMDGSNASDDASDRPGMRALAELGVRSPLREYGITKDEVRRLSEEAGLFTWDKPSYSCLATRVPTGRAITKESLARVERAENVLFQNGFTDFRVRLLGDGAKIQLPEGQMGELLHKREAVLSSLSDFTEVLLDLKPRR